MPSKEGVFVLLTLYIKHAIIYKAVQFESLKKLIPVIPTYEGSKGGNLYSFYQDCKSKL